MNLRTAGLILATSVAPMTARTPKTIKAAGAALPRIEQSMNIPQVAKADRGKIKVGMKFGNFYKHTADAKKRPSVAKTKQQAVYADNTVWNYDVTLNKKGETVTASTFAYNEKTGVTHGTFSDAESHLTYKGYTSRETFSDVKFSRIFGSEYSAVDKNGNGIVDAGEIYHNSKPPKGDASGINDEKNYGLNLSVKLFE